ncbi:MAG: hypothetical protein V7K27_26050 [Nostoc sp.]|uniref:hypothetical protein n=1 Tax=Nostoc sp. TaxID=1180 RepID=UPI002FF6BD95
MELPTANYIQCSIGGAAATPAQRPRSVTIVDIAIKRVCYRREYGTIDNLRCVSLWHNTPYSLIFLLHQINPLIKY